MPRRRIVCDFVWRDPSTGKSTIIGCFSSIGAPAFPATHPLLCVYAAITDGHGTVPIVLQLVDVDEKNPPLFEFKADLPFPDPRAVAEFNFVAANVVFPTPGEYRLQLFSGSHYLMERRIVLVDTGGKKDDESP
jgi:hypothetical protein